MTISPRLMNALVASGFADRYYALCQAHPYRELERCLSPHKEVVASLSAVGTVTKQKGPGRVYDVRVPEQPEGLDLSFIIQGQGVVVEPCLGVFERDGRSGSNFAVLAHGAKSATSETPPTPPYPRPYFYSLRELREVVGVAAALALSVSSHFSSSAP